MVHLSEELQGNQYVMNYIMLLLCLCGHDRWQFYHLRCRVGLYSEVRPNVTSRGYCTETAGERLAGCNANHSKMFFIDWRWSPKSDDPVYMKVIILHIIEC